MLTWHLKMGGIPWKFGGKWKAPFLGGDLVVLGRVNDFVSLNPDLPWSSRIDGLNPIPMS